MRSQTQRIVSSFLNTKISKRKKYIVNSQMLL